MMHSEKITVALFILTKLGQFNSNLSRYCMSYTKDVFNQPVFKAERIHQDPYCRNKLICLYTIYSKPIYTIYSKPILIGTWHVYSQHGLNLIYTTFPQTSTFGYDQVTVK